MKKYVYHFKFKAVEHKGQNTESTEQKGTIELVAPTIIHANRMFDQLYAAETLLQSFGSILGGKISSGLRASIAGTVLHVTKIEETEI